MSATSWREHARRVLGFRWVEGGYGRSTCRSCGAVRWVDYGDKDIAPSEKREDCSRNCPWRNLEDALAASEQNPLQHELLDLITLMPDFQVDEILNYVAELRAARAAGKR